MKKYELHLGDCIDVMRAMPDSSVDSIVTDPPYELGFMGKGWDKSGIANSVEMWREAMRVLKPGGHLLAFSGSRTYHRMTCAIEDAGLEIRDQIMWVYGSGFPKSRDVSKDMDRMADAARQWQGWGTSLKPAHEPVCVARKPLMSASINVLQMVESQLRERGVRGEIMWKPENVSVAAKKKSRKSSLSTNQPQAAETSAGNAGENETPSEGLQIVTSSEQSMLNGEMQTVSTSASTTRESVMNCATKCSTPTVGSAHVAERQSGIFSPSTTSTAAAQPTEKQSTEKSTTNFGEMDSPSDIECFAGIATGLTGSMAHVRINLDSSGFFIWPPGLPKHVAGSPLTVAANVLAHGTGALNIDECRVGWPDGKVPEIGTPGWGGPAKKLTTVPGQEGKTVERSQPSSLGRFPANLIHDGSPEVAAMFPDSNGAGGSVPQVKITGYGGGAVGTGESQYLGGPRTKVDSGTGSAARFFMNCKSIHNEDLWQNLNLPKESASTADQNLCLQRKAAVSALELVANSALPEGRYCGSLYLEPSTSATEIELRLIASIVTQTIQSIGAKFWHESAPARLSLSFNRASAVVIQRLTDTTTITIRHWKSDGSADPVTFSIMRQNSEAGGRGCDQSTASRFMYCAKASKRDRGEGNNHPTVKPTALMAYLCRLVTPPGGTVLDPFMGSGSTGKAAMIEGFRFIGIDMTPEYIEIARARIEAAGMTPANDNTPADAKVAV